MPHVAIIGGGIAGLATALALQDRAAGDDGGLRISLLEAGSRPGGNIRTEVCDGFTIETGPNGFLDNVPAMTELVARLGLTAQLQPADGSASSRFLYRNGRLHQLPTNLATFLGSSVLSARGRMRLVLEPFARRRAAGTDETIYEFSSRRIGSEAADVLIDAMVSGIYAGDTRSLSLASTFPKLAEMEAEHGSLTRAMLARLARRRKHEARAASAGGPAGPGGTLTSFRNGLQTLIDGLTKELQGTIETGQEVTAMEYLGPSRLDPVWRITTRAGHTITADAAVLAIPAPRAGHILNTVDDALGDAITRIPSAGLAVVALGYELAAAGGSLNGFGFLVPRREGLRSLGCLWDSSVFPGRAPDDKVLLRVMIGGAHDPDAIGLDDGELLSIAAADLETTMGLKAAPSLTRVYRYPIGIAQYVRGHRDRLSTIQARLRELPGLWMTGSSFEGISMNACVENAQTCAREIVASLRLD